MAKELKIHPNERIDIPDFDRAASDYTSELVSAGAERILADRRSRVLGGFRVRIEDQTANPGQITVINGTALDRDGSVLHDEDQANASVTLTLTGGSTTFYVEVERIESDSDSDSRSFWDADFDNGGAPNPDGAEFTLTVATRRTPTWRVVNPVSTTGFQSTTNPDSLRVPLAILSTDGGNVIDSGSTPGLVEVDAATVTETSVAVAGTSLRVFNSRLLGGSGDQVTLGFGLGTAELVTLTGNDLDNGVISFGATANAHSPGEIVQAAGVGRLLREQTDPNDPTAHPDSSQRMWQGDEVRGGALAQSKEDVTGRDDLNVRSLKDKLDLHDALLREVKFGSFDPATISADPATAFNARPRYIDPVGSLAGARYPTVSIGNGTTSFGDHNGTDETPFLDAISLLSAQGGGVLHVKPGTYIFTATVTVTDSITIIGAGRESTIIQNNVAAGPALRFDMAGTQDTDKISMKDIKMTVGTGADEAFELETVAAYLENCTFSDMAIQVTGGTGIASRIVASACTFSAAGAGVIGGIQGTSASGYEEVLENSSFMNCYFLDGTGLRAGLALDVNNVSFWQCVLTGLGWVIQLASTNAVSDLSLYSCQSNTTTTVVNCKGPASRVSIVGCELTLLSAGAGQSCVFFGDDVDGFTFDSNTVTSTWSGTSTGSPGRLVRFDADVSNVVMRNSSFTATSGQVVHHVTFEGAGTYEQVKIDTCEFTTFYSGIYILSGVSRASFVVDNCLFDANAQTFEQNGVYQVTGDASLTVRNCVFDNFDHATTRKTGVRILSTAADDLDPVVTQCSFSMGGVAGVDDLSACVWIEANATTTTFAPEISYNRIRSITFAQDNFYGFFVDGSDTDSAARVIGNEVSAMSSSAASPDVFDAIRLVSVRGGVVSNNIVDSMTVLNGANGAGIVLNDCYSLSVTGNVIQSPAVVGSPTTYSAGIYIVGGGFRNSVTNNIIRANGGATHGIHVNLTSGMLSLHVDSNEVYMDTDMEIGIYMAGASLIKGFSCSHNTVDNLSLLGSAVGIDLDLPASASVITVVGNRVLESVFDDEHKGIRVIGSVGSEAQMVTVSNNVVSGLLGGVIDRLLAGVGLHVNYCDYITVANNVISWCDNAFDGIGLEVANGFHGAITGNIVSPGQTGGFNDIDVSSAGDMIIDGNVYGNGSDTGAIAAAPGTSWSTSAVNNTSNKGS